MFTLTQFNPLSIANYTAIRIYALPAEPDINIVRNIILTMDVNDLQAVNLSMKDTSRPTSTGQTRYVGGRTY